MLRRTWQPGVVPSDDQQADDAFAFRLSWPGDPASDGDERADEPSPETEVSGDREHPAEEVPPVSPPRADDAAVGSAPSFAHDQPGRRPSDSPQPDRGSDGPSGVGQEVAPVQANAERVARLVVEAYDRLGGEVRGELRAMQADLDVDLAAVRGELASLRTSIGDVAERVQLRHLRSAIDELRSDVTALRRSVVEAPELEQVTSDVANLRSAMVDLLEKQVELSRELAAATERLSQRDDSAAPALEALHRELGGLRSLVGGLRIEDLGAAVEDLQEDLGSFRPVGEGISSALGLLQAEVGVVQQGLHDMGDRLEVSPRSSDLAAVRNELAALRDQVDALAVGQARRQSEERLAMASMTPLIEELTALRAEVEALRRRTQVSPARGLTPADLERELDAAFERHRMGDS